MTRIRAQESLTLILNVMQASPGEEGFRGNHYVQTLIEQGYGHDPEQHAIILEALTRK